MHPSDNDPLNRATGPPGGQVSGGSPAVTPNTLRDQAFVASAPREGFLTGSFVWMFVGVLLSSARPPAFLMNNETLQAQVVDLWLFLLIGQLGLVFAIEHPHPRASRRSSRWACSSSTR